MIRGFRHRGLERSFQSGAKSGIHSEHAARLRLVLGRQPAAVAPKDMNLPGLGLHAHTRTITDMASRTHNPPHPGEILRELCLKPLGLSVTDAAKALGVSRKTLSAVLNGRAGVSPEMAVRLSIAFDTTAESWLNQQMQFDLWLAEKRRKSLKVSRVAA